MMTFYPLARESWGWLLHALGYPDVPPAFDYGHPIYGDTYAITQNVGSGYQRADGSSGIFNRQLNIDLRGVEESDIGEYIGAAFRSEPKRADGSNAIRGYGRLPLMHGFDSAIVWSPEVPVLMRIVHEYREKGQPVYDLANDRFVPAALARPPVSQVSLLLDVELPECLLRAPELAFVFDYLTAPACQREYGHAGDHGWEGPRGLKLTWPARETTSHMNDEMQRHASATA